MPPLFPARYRAVVDALAELPARLLLTLGEPGDPAALGPLPANVHAARFRRQHDVMPHAVAVIGHGGFGTTLTGLAHGVPQVALPRSPSTSGRTRWPWPGPAWAAGSTGWRQAPVCPTRRS